MRAPQKADRASRTMKDAASSRADSDAFGAQVVMLIAYLLSSGENLTRGKSDIVGREHS